MHPSIRHAPLVGLVLLALGLAGCATMRVNSYAERGADLRHYRTYAWSDEAVATGDARLDNNQFFQDRVQGDVDKQLGTRGFERVTTSTPELVIHYHASLNQQIDISGADRKYGCDNCKPFVYDAGTLLIDFVDARTNKLVWRGWAEDRMDRVIDNQEWMEQEIDEAIVKILDQLPPRL